MVVLMLIVVADRLPARKLVYSQQATRCTGGVLVRKL